MSSSNDQPDMNRRKLIGSSVAAATVATVAPGVFLHTVAKAKEASEPVSDEVRWGMLIDTSKCKADCTACIDACNEASGINLLKKPEHTSDERWNEIRPQWIRKIKLKDKQTDNITNMVMMCQHCEFPPCVDVCPTGASFKRVDGIVMVDRHTCIGCRYCMMACPYKARSFIHENIVEQRIEAPRGKGCVESCNLCAPYLDEDATTTACVVACNEKGHGAMLFGDLNDENSEISKALKEQKSQQIRADLELNTGVRYSNI